MPNLSRSARKNALMRANARPTFLFTSSLARSAGPAGRGQPKPSSAINHARAATVQQQGHAKPETPVRNRWPRTGDLSFFETDTSKFGQGGNRPIRSVLINRASDLDELLQ